VRHRLGLATRTQISVRKSSFPSEGTAVSLFRAKTVQQRPLLPREVETWLPDCDGRRQSSQLVAGFRPMTDIALTDRSTSVPRW